MAKIAPGSPSSGPPPPPAEVYKTIPGMAEDYRKRAENMTWAGQRVGPGLWGRPLQTPEVYKTIPGAAEAYKKRAENMTWAGQRVGPGLWDRPHVAPEIYKQNKPVVPTQDPLAAALAEETNNG